MPAYQKSYEEVLDALGIMTKRNVPNTPMVTNQILLEMLIQQRIAMTVADVGYNWDTFEVWVRPGAVPTKVVPVTTGDVVVVKIVNHDLDNAQPIYYGQQNYLNRPVFNGLLYTLQLSTDLFIDFDEGGGEVSATIPAGEYNGETLATALSSLMTAASGVAATHTVTYNPATKVFETAHTVSTNLLVATGTHVGLGTDIFGDIDFTGSDTGLATSHTGDTLKFNEYDDENQEIKPFPLFAGDSTILVLESDLYAILPSDATLQAPLAIRRSLVYKK